MDAQDSLMISIHCAIPRYKVMINPEAFEVSINVSGFKPEEITVGLKGGGRIFIISVHHKQNIETPLVFLSITLDVLIQCTLFPLGNKDSVCLNNCFIISLKKVVLICFAF